MMESKSRKKPGIHIVIGDNYEATLQHLKALMAEAVEQENAFRAAKNKNSCNVIECDVDNPPVKEKNPYFESILAILKNDPDALVMLGSLYNAGAAEYAALAAKNGSRVFTSFLPELVTTESEAYEHLDKLGIPRDLVKSIATHSQPSHQIKPT